MHVCPGNLKHPGDKGYSDSHLTASDAQERIDASLGSINRYCWILDDNHLVIDVDLHDVAKNGLESLTRLSSDLGIDLLSQCQCVVETPTGGLHLCFLKPRDLKLVSLISKTELGSITGPGGVTVQGPVPKYPGLDTWAKCCRDNALVICPGSTHPLTDGKYRFRSVEPRLALSPDTLLDYLEITEQDQPSGTKGVNAQGNSIDIDDVSRGDRTPIDDFNFSERGLTHIGRVMESAGYRFTDAGDHYEFVRPGKTTASKCSGYLGKISESGRYLLTCFSGADDLLPEGVLPPNKTITISEALIMLRNNGQRGGGSDGVGYGGLMTELKAAGFGMPTVDEMFGSVAHLVNPDGSNVGPPPEVVTAESIPEVTGEFWNYTNVQDGTDKNGNPKVIKVGRTMPDLLGPFISGGWPKACNGSMFVPDSRKTVRILSSSSMLMSWMQLKTKVCWAEGGGDKIGRDQFFQGLAAAVPHFESIASAPHFPPVPDVYYARKIPVGDVQDFYDFVDHFFPADGDVDRQLMRAAVATVFWGGSGGTRPLFLITSSDGQGAGKSVFVQAIAKLTGLGKVLMHQIRSPKDFEKLSQTLGSASPTSPETSRMIVVDNFKGAMLGSQEIEALITEQMLSVWKLYHGEVRVPNLYTWFVTGNGVDMSEDLAQRTIEIRIRKPKQYSAEWSEKLENWDVMKVLSGIAAFFETPPTAIDKTLRFDRWSRDILGRLENPGLLAEECLNRSKNVSVSANDAHEIGEHLEAYVESLGDSLSKHTDPDGCIILRTTWVSRSLNLLDRPDPRDKRWTSNFLSRILRRLGKPLCVTPVRTNQFNGFLWNRKAFLAGNIQANKSSDSAEENRPNNA